MHYTSLNESLLFFSECGCPVIIINWNYNKLKMTITSVLIKEIIHPKSLIKNTNWVEYFLREEILIMQMTVKRVLKLQNPSNQT